MDAKLATALKRLLLGYNLSRNVKVELATDLDLWTILPMSAFEQLDNQDEPEEYNEPAQLEEIDSDDIKLVADPRLGSEYLGYRFLTRLGGKEITDIGKYIKLAGGGEKKRKIRLYEGSFADYVKLRYRLGVSEGLEDIRSAFYYPFELNGDLLNAVSLNKGLQFQVFVLYLLTTYFSQDCTLQKKRQSKSTLMSPSRSASFRWSFWREDAVLADALQHQTHSSVPNLEVREILANYGLD